MANLTKKIKEIDVQIKSKNAELREAEFSLYYKIFSCEEKRNEDIKDVKAELRELLSLKYATIESLQREYEFVKAAISNQQRFLTIQVNA
jgi:hypothetical protein